MLYHFTPLFAVWMIDEAQIIKNPRKYAQKIYRLPHGYKKSFNKPYMWYKYMWYNFLTKLSNNKTPEKNKNSDNNIGILLKQQKWKS